MKLSNQNIYEINNCFMEEIVFSTFKTIKWNYLVVLTCFLIVTNSIAQHSDNPIFKNLDFSKNQLKQVENFYQKGHHNSALKELLSIYRSKENIYLKLKKEDVTNLKLNNIESVNQTIKRADEVLNKYFLFRYDWDMEKTNIPHQFKSEIDWKAIPNGDEEWCYMLNRHRYWIDLGKAYLLTGNEKYAKGFVKQVTHWIDNNPLEDGLKKYSWRRIEAGIRGENWIKSFEYFKKSKHITSKFLAKFLNSLYEHGTYLNSSFSNFSKTSNWGVIEFQGLFNISVFLNEFKIASQWQKDAIDKLTTCIKLQILEDGSQWEQSPMYHNEVFHCYMNINLIAQRKNIVLPEIMVQKTKDMAYANVKWQKPNFHQPVLGDSDDTDLRGFLTLASILFDDPVLKSRSFEEIDYELQFIMGKDEAESYKNKRAIEPAFLSAYQKSSGDFYMRTSWEENATYTSLHLKKLGCGHGHDNLLHFTLYANGRDYLIDGGRYSYIDNEWRAYFKNNKSHNTLGVDNLTNSIYQDSWINKYEARSQGVFTKSTKNFDYAEAENTAYKRLEDPVSMKRRMLFLKPNIWLIFDSFSANKTHTYSQYFNFPDKKVQIVENGIETTFEKNNLRIQPIKNVQLKLTDEWVSPEYNLKIANKRAELFKKATGFTSFISVLYFPELTELRYEKIPVFSRNDVLLSDKDVEAVNIYLKDKKYTLLVVHNSPAPASNFFKVNNMIVQGEVVFIEKNKKGTNVQIIK